ncbi:MAG: S1 RNA-binding domain-containing protein [Chloroflexi bacterium]|nr:S1 RNA-binding domain-containing protein [Chloroflexota bacterium]
MDEAEKRPEEHARAIPRRQDVESNPEFGNNAQDMGALLEQYEESQHTQLRRGELVEGTVVLVDRDEILVDIGGKMEAVIATGEIQNEKGELSLQRGDHVSAVVIVPENSDGRPVISINRARAEIGWRDLQIKKDAEEVVTGEIVDHNKGGLIVSVDGVRGFVPLSQIVELRRGGTEDEVEDKLRSMRGQTLYLKVIEMNRRRNRLILSERAAAQERRAQQKDRLLAELQAGEIRHGRVSSLTDFGAFVDLGGADGLIHLSELSWGQVQHPSQVLRVGQEVDVRVVGVDRENKKIALSLKQVEENPWTRIEAKYHVGDTVPAKITKLAQFGAFAELEPGVEGLVHISELSDERITHPKQVVREGEDVQLRIIKIDPPRHRLGLSLRQAEDVGEGGYGGFEAWSGGTSYGAATATPTEDGADVPERDLDRVPEEGVHSVPEEHVDMSAEHDGGDQLAVTAQARVTDERGLIAEAPHSSPAEHSAAVESSPPPASDAAESASIDASPLAPVSTTREPQAAQAFAPEAPIVEPAEATIVEPAAEVPVVEPAAGVRVVEPAAEVPVVEPAAEVPIVEPSGSAGETPSTRAAAREASPTELADAELAPSLPSPLEEPPKAPGALPGEPPNPVHALPADQAEPSATEQVHNGTARVPER